MDPVSHILPLHHAVSFLYNLRRVVHDTYEILVPYCENCDFISVPVFPVECEAQKWWEIQEPVPW